MLVRVVKSCLLIVLGLALVAGPAKATTLGPGLYSTDFFVKGPGAFMDVYEFDVVPGGSLGTTLSATTLSPSGSGNLGIANLVIKWDEFLPSTQFTDPVTAVLNSTAVLTATLVPSITYHLRVTGFALSAGGKYSYSISATPLPAAVVLFGTGLLGLTLLGRRRNRPRAVL